MTGVTPRAALRVALFCLGVLALSCREGSTDAPGQDPVPFRMNFAAGETFVYDAWLLDEFGYTIPSSRTRAVSRVLGVYGPQGGFEGVTTFQDSTVILRDTVIRVYDTVSVAFTAEGDVYRYGMLAYLARVQKRPYAVPRQWERIAAFSVGFGQSWLVGYLDSARSVPVFGRISGAPDMFSVRVKGQQTVFPGYRVDLSGASLDYSFWVSDAPAAFLRYRLEPDFSRTGGAFEITEIRAGS